MPSFDDEKIIRTPSFKAKLQQLQGLRPEEKALMLRIGNLIDFLTYNQRAESNPKGRSRKKSNTVPTPQKIIATAISGGLVVSWTPVDFSELSFYEVQISNDSVFSSTQDFQVVDKRFVYKQDIRETIFVRVRTVSKRGLVSAWSNTASAIGTIQGSDADFDSIDPENRTTVPPKPTLVGATLAGDRAFVGVGAAVFGSPLTMEDRHSGFPNKSRRINEITYDLIDEADPCTSIEQRVMGLCDDFIESSNFYNLEVPGTNNQRFYFRTFIYTGSFVDFFRVADLTIDPSTLDVEFLRYRVTNTFYQPDFGQTGVVESAVYSVFKL